MKRLLVCAAVVLALFASGCSNKTVTGKVERIGDGEVQQSFFGRVTDSTPAIFIVIVSDDGSKHYGWLARVIDLTVGDVVEMEIIRGLGPEDMDVITEKDGTVRVVKIKWFEIKELKIVKRAES